MKTQEEVFKIAEEKGCVQLKNGFWLCSQKEMLEKQKQWDSENVKKKFDFTRSNYWLLTDKGEFYATMLNDYEIDCLLKESF